MGFGFKVPITLSQLYEISKIYVCLRRFLKKLNVFWFLSPFNHDDENRNLKDIFCHIGYKKEQLRDWALTIL